MVDTNPIDSKGTLTPLVLVLIWLGATMSWWWFALSATPSADPDWLERARTVCFGTGPSGLPDGGGWLMLTLAPLSILAALCVAMGREIAFSMAYMLRALAGRLLLLTLIPILGLHIVWATGRVQDGLARAEADFGPVDRGTLPAHYPQTAKPAPDFSLIDQHGQTVELKNFTGKVLVLTFAFAHCQTVCPALVATARTALAELPAESAELLIITLDPWRDTPGSLPHLAQQWDLPNNARVLSGDVENVNEIIKRYNIPTNRDLKTGDVTHPALIYVLAPDSTIAYTFNNPSVAWLRQGVRNVL